MDVNVSCHTNKNMCAYVRAYVYVCLWIIGHACSRVCSRVRGTRVPRSAASIYHCCMLNDARRPTRLPGAQTGRRVPEPATAAMLCSCCALAASRTKVVNDSKSSGVCLHSDMATSQNQHHAYFVAPSTTSYRTCRAKAVYISFVSWKESLGSSTLVPSLPECLPNEKVSGYHRHL